MHAQAKAPVSTSARVLRLLFEAATPDNLESIGRALGLPPGAVSADPDALVGLPRPFSFWRDLSHLADDPHFGLHAGERMDHGALGVFGYILLSSASFRDALERAAALLRLADDLVAYVLTEEGDRASLALCYDGEPMMLPGPVAEFSLTGIVSLVRRGVGDDFAPIEVRFRHPAPADTAEHRRVLRCPVAFSAARTELLFSRHHLDRPALRHDPRLCGLLTAIARERVDALRAEDHPFDHVERAYRAGLRVGETDLEAIASRLQMSGRTLQRYLKKADTSHLRMLDRARRCLALRWAEDPARSAEEIVTTLRFPSALHFARAFRRWTGSSPSEYRERKLTPAPTASAAAAPDMASTHEALDALV
jgi:AraC-like DNA-binding protein